MADEPDKHEKTEQATPFKIEEARKKGMVAKSQEVNSLIVLTAGLLLLFSLGMTFALDVLDICRRIFMSSGGMDLVNGELYVAGKQWVRELLVAISPIILFLMLAGVFANLMQTGPIFSAHPLKPDFKKLNPVQGFKRIFSMRLLYESGKNILKLIVFTAIVYWAAKNDFKDLLTLFYQSPKSYLPSLLPIFGGLVFKLLMAILVVAVIDFLFVKREYLDKLKMTRKELKDEIKRRDGDPHIKSKRRELENELRKRAQSLAAVPDSDVVVTNPTHYAVILKYDRNIMRAPKVVGKGADEMAKQIRKEANRYRVPIIESPILARFLFKKAKIDSAVPESSYKDVARILSEAYRRKAESENNSSSKRNLA
ncbi:MAG: flagellar biosynthesis protein FlhB [Pseudomonadales bacterium]|nr:flagellar biosynthesis protein FlhB [Pseudomonadales bacterium]